MFVRRVEIRDQFLVGKQLLKINTSNSTWTIKIVIAMKKKDFMHCIFDNFIDNNESRRDFDMATEVWMNQKFLYLQVFCLMKQGFFKWHG